MAETTLPEMSDDEIDGIWRMADSPGYFITGFKARCLIERLRNAQQSEAGRRIDQYPPPKHTDILLYRDDMGWVAGRYTHLAALISDEELERQNVSDEDAHENDWWGWDNSGMFRITNDGPPTHWHPFPTTQESQG